GVEIQNIGTTGVHDFLFDTVSANRGGTNATTGLVCGVVNAQLVFADDLVYGNVVTGTGTQVGGDSHCTWTYSDVGPQATNGTGTLDAARLFVSPSTGDSHLQPGSPAIDAAAPAATLSWDIDGDARPAGARSDIGADEVVP